MDREGLSWSQDPPSHFADWLKSLVANEFDDVAVLAASEVKFDALFVQIPGCQGG